MARKNVTQQKQKMADIKGQKRSKQFGTDSFVRSLLKKIRSEAGKPDDDMIHIARLVADLKAYVERRGIMGDQTWYEWAPKAFWWIGDINKLRLLNDLAEAPLNEARGILARHRRNGARRTRLFRKRAKAKAEAVKSMAMDRQWIIRWATAAETKDVRKVWRYLKREFDA